MQRLDSGHKAFIVRKFAHGYGVSEVCRVFEDEFGFKIETGHAYYYYLYSIKRLSQKWRDYFEETRRAYATEMCAADGRKRAQRIQRLWDMAEASRRKGEFRQAADLPRQIADEMDNEEKMNQRYEQRAAARRAAAKPQP